MRWDWQDDGAYDTPWSTTKIIDHTINIVGHHFIRLQVRDSNGLTDSTDQLVKVGLLETLFVPLVLKAQP